MFGIQDTAYKFGCGRYIQKPGALSELADEIRRLGESAYVLTGKNAWAATKNQVMHQLERIPHHLVEFNDPCNEEMAEEYAAEALEEGREVIVGIGGGRIMDYAKLVAYKACLPVINVPTITATCAAFTPLSVVYTPEGGALGSDYFDREVSCVLADTAVLARQPLRCAAAGVLDSLAKLVETAHNCGKEVRPKIDQLFATHAAMFLTEKLTGIAPKLPEILEKGEPCAEIEELAYLTIPVTGIISGISRGSGQSAYAHALYETMRLVMTREVRNAMHGEIVGVGIRLQLIADDLSPEEIDQLMRTLKLPMTLRELGISTDRASLTGLAEKMVVHCLLADEHVTVERMVELLEKIA